MESSDSLEETGKPARPSSGPAAPGAAAAPQARAAGPLRFRYLRSIHDVSRDAWDSLEPRHTFASHAWLAAFEDGGLVRAGTDLEYRIPVLIDPHERIVAAAPGMLKWKNLADYGPENHWVREAEARGIASFPRLQLESPLTPVGSPRFLVHPAWPRAQAIQSLLQALLTTTHAAGLAALTIARMTAGDQEAARAAGGSVESWEIGTLWRNEGYSTFADFLSPLKAAYRYRIHRERREFRSHRLTLRALRGSEIRAEHWDDFFRGHVRVCERKRAPVLLTRNLLERLSCLGDAIWLIGVFSGSQYRAGNFAVHSGDTLYCRSWSELEFTPTAHFEAAIYRPIEMAIELGLKKVDGGVWGAHKPARGLLPVALPNAHWIRDARVRAMAQHVATGHRRAYDARWSSAGNERYLHGPSGARE